MAVDDLDYAQVTGRFGVMVGDSDDADAYPEFVPCTGGTITFTPELREVQGTLDGDPVRLSAAAVSASVDDAGYLTYRGVRGVWLVDLGSSKISPRLPLDTASYTVSFDNMTADGVLVKFGGFSFHPQAGSVTNVTLAAPLPTPGKGTQLVVSGVVPDTATAAQGDVVTFDGAKPVWAPATGGSGGGLAPDPDHPGFYLIG